MRLEVLGPVRIVRGSDTHEIGSGRQRSVLAHLIAAGGRPVSKDRLIESIWGSQLPANPENTLQHAVAQLRKVLEPGRSAGEAPKVLLSDADGYRLDLTGHELDIDELSTAVDEASALVDRGELAAANDVIESGLRLWRGQPFSNVEPSETMDREIDRLEDLWISARLLAAEVAAIGDPGSAVPVLEALTAEYPLREALWGKLMEALYRSGRQAEALRAYARVSDILGSELGLVPSKELRDLEESILLQDARLEAERGGNATVPVPLLPMIGRKKEIDDLRNLISDRRLVSLLGPGGSGKTRLAIEAASAFGPELAEVVWFVRLDELEDGSLLASKVGTTIGMPEDPDRSVEDTLAMFIGARSALLVLDNCEHLAGGVADLVATLLERCPQLTVLATSQQALNVRGEHRMEVPPLQLPGEGDASPFSDIDAVDSVRLFIERAKAVDPELDLSEENLRAIANIVRALDGMPLAIELAAARTDLFTPVELAVRLGDRFGLLTDGPRDAPARQRGLRSVFEWSFSLLDDNGRRCLSELSVFTGTFSPEAAAAVLDKAGNVTQTILSHFVQRSLLQRDRSVTGSTRFRMLESLRHFAAEMLAVGGAEVGTRERHATFYLDRVATLDEDLTGSNQATAFSQMVVESENIRSVLAWALRSGRMDVCVPLAANCGRFWDWRGSVAEALTWYRRLSESGPGADEAPLAGMAFSWYGYFVMESGDIEGARSINRRARVLSGEANDTLSAAAAATVGAVIARYENDLETALELDALVRTHARHLDDPWLEAWVDCHEALCLLADGDPGGAAEAAETSLAGFQRLGDQRGVGWSQTILATIALDTGDLDSAAEWAASAGELSYRVGDGRNAAWALEIGASAAEAAGDVYRAKRLRADANQLINERGVPFSPWRR